MVKADFLEIFKTGELLQCFEEECGLWQSDYVIEFHQTHEVLNFFSLSVLMALN